VAESRQSTAKFNRPTIVANAKEATTTELQDVVITGVGVVLPGAVGVDALAKLMSTDAPPTLDSLGGPIPVEKYEHLLSARRTRRMSGYAKLCLAATADAYANAGITDPACFGETCSGVVGSMHGAAEYCHTYYRQIIDEGVNAANPMLFAEGVPNVASAHLATTFMLKGFCQTLIGTRTAGLEALQLATAKIRAGVWDRAVVCAADDYNEIVSRAYRELLPSPSFIDGGGAVALILESRTSAENRGADIYGRITRTVGRSIAGYAPRSAAALVRDTITELGELDALATSGTTSPIDRIETLGMRMARKRCSDTTPTPVTTMYGRLPELYAAGPLASLAGLLCSRKCWPATDTPPSTRQKNSIKRSMEPPLNRAGVLCSDFFGSVCGVALELA